MNKLISNILKENEEDIDDFFKPKNLKSRERKTYEKFEAKCQETFHMSVDELRSIFFSLYDQMDEPERTKAKNDFDIENVMGYFIPRTIFESIIGGFAWYETPDGSKYWSIIADKYKNK